MFSVLAVPIDRIQVPVQEEDISLRDPVFTQSSLHDEMTSYSTKRLLEYQSTVESISHGDKFAEMLQTREQEIFLESLKVSAQANNGVSSQWIKGK